MNQNKSITGAGVGLRHEIIDALIQSKSPDIDFVELAPENWMTIGGARAKQLRKIQEFYPIIAHGLSLSLGSPAKLNKEFIHGIKNFMATYDISFYSEHLSFCSDLQGQLYDLLPIPLTEEAVYYVAKRIYETQEILEQKISIENISYYHMPLQAMKEIDFINAVMEEADCDLLLDVNNVYVNSVNHHYDPIEFINHIPKSRIRYIHIAGHYKEAKNLIIDTHGAKIVNSVWELLAYTYQLFGNIPTLLERDNEVPDLDVLLHEIHKIKQYQSEKHYA